MYTQFYTILNFRLRAVEFVLSLIKNNKIKKIRDYLTFHYLIIVLIAGRTKLKKRSQNLTKLLGIRQTFSNILKCLFMRRFSSEVNRYSVHSFLAFNQR